MSFLNFRYTSELRKYARDFGRSFRFYLVFIILIFAINVGERPKSTLFFLFMFASISLRQTCNITFSYCTK